MKYLHSFNEQLKFFRETHKLEQDDIAKLCGLDSSVVAAWESQTQALRVYPSLENLLDLCFKTGASLEYFIDAPNASDIPQLELPGLIEEANGSLDDSLSELDEQLEALLPKDQELELLRRFRKSDEQNKKLIIQLMGM